MSRILVLAQSGFGKSTSVGQIPELGIEGLNPETTYIISVTSKPLPFRKSATIYPAVTVPPGVTTLPVLENYKRIITNSPDMVAKALDYLAGSPLLNIVLDDFNYLMQDWYMDNALRTGWDAPKQIGVYMGKIFKSMEKYESNGKNLFVLAHGESVISPDGRTYLKMKTTGKMVDEYTTPEGKFDVTLLGISRYDSGNRKVIKEYLTNENEMYSSAKSPVGMFDTITIPNDLGLVVTKIKEYYE